MRARASEWSRRWAGCGLAAWALLVSGLSAAPAAPAEPEFERAKLKEALAWINQPAEALYQYDYVMTVKVRFLFFWIGRDDVGGGYIRRSVDRSNPNHEMIEVLFGSDPEKAPRRINRWGAGTEVVRRPETGGPAPASGFIGFMKKSEGESVAEMESELAAEQDQGRHLFQAILSRVDPNVALAEVLPFYSDRDFNLHELEVAQKMVFTRFSGGKLRRLERRSDDGCQGNLGFLATLAELIDAALEGARAPQSRCYIYNARRYTATLERVKPIERETIKVKLHGSDHALRADYENLLKARFRIRRSDSDQTTSFELLLGTAGELRGVPIQIVHQPNFWFKVVLNLKK